MRHRKVRHSGMHSASLGRTGRFHLLPHMCRCAHPPLVPNQGFDVFGTVRRFERPESWPRLRGHHRVEYRGCWTSFDARSIPRLRVPCIVSWLLKTCLTRCAWVSRIMPAVTAHTLAVSMCVSRICNACETQREPQHGALGNLRHVQRMSNTGSTHG